MTSCFDDCNDTEDEDNNDDNDDHGHDNNNDDKHDNDDNNSDEDDDNEFNDITCYWSIVMYNLLGRVVQSWVKITQG